MAQYWLMKSEPDTFSWEDLVNAKSEPWDGVRNFEARNNMRAMRRGDRVLFYHSGKRKEIVGVAEVVREYYPDHSALEGDWSMVDIAPVVALATPVTLAQIKADPGFEGILLVRRSRLSVVAIDAPHFKRILRLGATKL